MTGDELRDRIEERILRDPRLRRIRARIAKGKATASDSFSYSRICSEIMSEELSRAVLELDDREGTAADLLRGSYGEIMQTAETIQRSMDAKQGIHMQPRRSAFPAERVQQIAHALADPTVPDEMIVRRAGSTATVSMSFHDDFVRENAKFRAKAGLKCYITRTTDGDCCKWCSKMAGRYEYGDEPQDVYRRHDNCGCSVTYENGRQRQDVWPKRTWEVPDKDTGAPKSVRLTAEQAAALEAQHAVIAFTPEQAKSLQNFVLTNGTERGKIKVNDRFYKEGADPMFTAFGRAEDSNPKELAELQARLAAIGVGFERHDEEDAALAYQNTQVGKPGSISVTPNASFSAWLHEAKHAFDDFEAGWNACLAVWDVEEHIRREINAYQEEIDYAISLGRQDIAKQLEQLRDDEIAEIRRRDEEYARLYGIYGEGGT